MGDFFAKCSAAHPLLNQCTKTVLRAKWQFLGFARKRRSPVTGKKAIFEICP